MTNNNQNAIYLQDILGEGEATAAMLQNLLAVASENVLTTIVAHPEADMTIWWKLVDHPSVEVRETVADYAYGDTEIMRQIMRNAPADLLFAIAENHNMPEEILEALAEADDQNPYIVHRAQKTLRRCRESQSKVARKRIFENTRDLRKRAMG